MVTLWIVAAVVFLIVEAVTAAMNSIWFVAGSLAALIGAALGAPIWAQLALFVGVSGVCFAILYPRLKRLLRRDSQPTNADMVIGQECVVTQRIDNGGETLEPGTVVSADSIEGVKLIVSPVRQVQTAEG